MSRVDPEGSRDCCTKEVLGTQSGEKCSDRVPHVGQSLQLLALVIRDHTIHHHPLGAIQDFGVHGETDAFIKQRTTCESRTRWTRSQGSSAQDLLTKIRDSRGTPSYSDASKGM